jgi:hypothetical protein
MHIFWSSQQHFLEVLRSGMDVDKAHATPSMTLSQALRVAPLAHTQALLLLLIALRL